MAPKLIDRTQLPVLLVRTGSRVCALPLESVVETMRPLPTAPVSEMPTFLRGLAIIRGSPAPVVDLGTLFGVKSDVEASRFVLLRLGERRAAIAVNEILGVRRLDCTALQTFPPLLQDAYAELVTAIEVRDQQLLFVLSSTRIVPIELWQRLESNEVVS